MVCQVYPRIVVGPPGFEPGISAVLIGSHCEGDVLTSWTTGPSLRSGLPSRSTDRFGSGRFESSFSMLEPGRVRIKEIRASRVDCLRMG